MPWTNHEVRIFGSRLLPSIYDINRALKRDRINCRLTSLLHEIESGDMKIRITETTFFLGKQRQVGDVLDNVIVGPFRTQVVPGGLERIPQYVEMPQELPQAPQPAPVAPSTAAVTVPPVVAIAPTEAAPVKAAPKANPLAARVRSLTARRAKFQDLVAGVLDTGEETMTKLETDAPVILAKANQDASDEYTAIEDLASAMKSFAASNGEPT